jgi:1-acyl-sn-glycerol-3-phosphate acyltransferase
VIRGLVTTLLLALNLFLWGSLVLVVASLKLVTRGETRRRVILTLAALGDRWVAANKRIFRLMLPVTLDIEVPGGLYRDGHYLIFSNHISWVDIFLVFQAFHDRVAFVRFFMKRQLLWMPVVGLACWALEFPFMRRYTAEYLAKYPEKRGTDLETTRRACRRYRKIPVAILNFLEGTRFTYEKHADQDSPYRHLLRPRVGGIAFVLASLGEQLDGAIDVTIAYPGHLVTFWEFVCGRVPRATVRARCLDIPGEFLTSDITQPGPARDHFKAWIETLWREKDDFLVSLTAPEREGRRLPERRETGPE